MSRLLGIAPFVPRDTFFCVDKGLKATYDASFSVVDVRVQTMTRSAQKQKNSQQNDPPDPLEIALVGDLTEREHDLTERILEVSPGEDCTIYFDSPGGSPYAAMSIASLIKIRGIRATGIVTGECSSAALWPFATCEKRFVTPFSVLLFHPMKWQSEEHIGIHEAAEWSQHFSDLEQEMDHLLAELFGVTFSKIDMWAKAHRYVRGQELVEAGIAEMMSLDPRKNSI